MRNGGMMLVVFDICQIVVLYVLMFAENWDYFMLGCLLVCVFAKNRQDYYVLLVMYVC
jgi:VanZ family protein